MEEQLTPLQLNVLEKYKRLSDSLLMLDKSIKQLNENKKQNSKDISPEEVLQEIREVEVKIGLIGTLLKGSVYSFILQRKQEAERAQIKDKIGGK